MEEFLQPLGISEHQLAKDPGVPRLRITEIVQGKGSISADTALRLGRCFGIDAQFWLNLQRRYDLLPAEQALSTRLDHEVRPHTA